MEDIKGLLTDLGKEKAAFEMDGRHCYLYIPTENRKEHIDIVSRWEEIEENDSRDSDIVYCFMNMFAMCEEEQREKIQEVVEDGGTRLL